MNLVKVNNIPVIPIIDAIDKGQVTTADEIASKFNIEPIEAIKMLADEQFIQLVQKFTRAKLLLNYHSKAVNKLLSLIDEEHPRYSLDAIKLLGKMVGEVQPDTNISLNINLEQLIDKTEKLNPTIDIK